ncbi:MULTISPECIES: pyridoxamine 5'-phosphate oxidase family protein [Burkholderia]|uniref:Pyridoxamine 5'-phosphate oxidase n=1 Tax=Burkholderia contaminans TaxID=488447 RepID=A0A2S5E3I6_9BURK|nr:MULTISPECIES: pyridoxamine 5'-phosphate oxidase family protein [Burkholderia]EKS9797332.1 pyridoxamine 5'-phosphate oxidase family protein [Burkholderia cepacia]EKS9803974.1 pyridoxamine 5'-phosphate oxidase family protein [Burkholderia cepacia]EKS9814354.1 pyridoxamine 5'-phosphate oxidase family protein [Burkholderia cepacia]EKS9822961.1 pyridoxamine 5'-phosphate oxidase family protein [Burkholderia cepacia]EKS9828845.1 pyridoxamine 5'-phosphate oxidase family protein [Burkholderia cepaci
MPDATSESLAQTYERLWSCLESGVSAQRSPFTMLQAATLGIDGAPKVRTIVLRQVSRADRMLSFHTDARSEKVAELRRDPRIALVASDLDALVQIRVEGAASICDDEAQRRAIWQASRPHTLLLYRAPLPPGTPVASPEDAHVPASQDAASTDDGYDNFCLLHVTVTRIDWLELARAGHRRAVFDLHESGYEGRWVAP